MNLSSYTYLVIQDVEYEISYNIAKKVNKDQYTDFFNTAVLLQVVHGEQMLHLANQVRPSPSRKHASPMLPHWHLASLGASGVPVDCRDHVPFFLSILVMGDDQQSVSNVPYPSTPSEICFNSFLCFQKKWNCQLIPQQNIVIKSGWLDKPNPVVTSK